MRRSDLHPLVILLVEAFARESGVDPERQWRWLEGTEQAPPKWIAQQLWAFAPGLKEEDFASGLTTPHVHNTLPGMDASTNVLKSRAKMKADTKAAKAVAAKGLTYAQIHRVIGKELREVGLNTVQAWHKDKDDPSYRRVPDDVANFYRDTWHIPRSVWPSIIPPK